MLLTLLVSVPAFAKHPPRLFNEPVKLDDAGRPLYNQWERQEYERRLRERQRKLRRPLSTSTVPLTNVEKIPGGKRVGDTPKASSTQADNPTINPSKFPPTPTQPDSVAEQPPINSTPPHTQDYSF
jgi:hypothetical protein